MRRFSSRNQFSTLTELNITPLLDLAFVLLIIFMITTPLMENSLDLVVPTSSEAKTKVESSQVQIIGINRDAVLTLNGVPVTLEELEIQLRDLHMREPQMAVVVRTHQELPVQKFVNVMDLLGRVGIAKVGVMTHPEVAR